MKSCTQSATAPQQEADAEASTDTGNKSSHGSSSTAHSETASASKEKETSEEKSKDSSTLEYSGSRETPSSILLGSNQGSVSKRCDKQPAYTPTTTAHQPHPIYLAQKYHSRSSKTGLWSSSEEKRGSARSKHSAGTSTKYLMSKELRKSRLDTFWD
ncbi:hypothetical protein STEG23_015947 [Scotinomys teguina]